MGATAITSERGDFGMFGLRLSALVRLCLAVALLALSCVLTTVSPIHVTLPQRAPSALPVAAPQTQIAPPGLTTALRMRLPMPDPGPPDYTIAPIPDVPDTFAAFSAAQGFGVYFTPDGARLTAKAFGQMGLRLVAIGGASASLPIAAMAPVAAGTRVEYRHDTVTEWYENRAEGIEQGFTIAAPPTADTAGDLVLGIALDAHAGWQVADDTLTLPGGGLRYGDLRASDATGRSLPAHLTLADGTIRIAVDARGAVYPVVIDPTIGHLPTNTVYQVTGTNNGDLFGSGVAVSGPIGNATFAAFGAPGFSGGSNLPGQGEIKIARSTDAWITWRESQVITDANPNPLASLGSVLAFRNDTLFASAPNATVNSKGGAGKIVTFKYDPATGNFLVGQTITAPTPTMFAAFGSSFDLSGDGLSLLVGSPQDTNATGRVDFFTRIAGVYVEKFPLFAPGGVQGDTFGAPVRLSPDGTKSFIGAPAKDRQGKPHVGRVYAYQNGVSPPPPPVIFDPLVPTDNAFLGNSIVSNLDGTDVLIGAPGTGNFTGAIYPFGWPDVTKPPVQQPIITDPNAAQNQEFGWSMAPLIDANGNLLGLLSGTPFANSFAGGVVPVLLNGPTPTVDPHIAPPDSLQSSFGLNIATSLVAPDGTFLLLVGAPDATAKTAGEAIIFTGKVALGVGSTGASVLTNLSTPVRVVDTRRGATDACAVPGQPVTGGTTMTITLTSACTGIPTTVSGIVGNATAVNGVAPGFLTVFASGPLPPTSNVNFVAGVPVPNSVSVLVAPDGTIKVYVSVTVDVIVDVTAFLTAPRKPIITGISPPTGSTTGGTPLTIAGSNFQAGATVTIGGQPAGTVVVNPPPTGSNVGSITCTTPPGTVGAADVTVNNPDGSTVTLKGGFSYTTGSSRAGTAIVAHAPANTGLVFHSLPKPVRLFDSRPGQTACLHPNTPLATGAPVNLLAVSACTGVPAGAQTIVGNGTAVAPAATGPGYVTFYPGGVPTPTVSNLNYVPGQVVPNAFTVGLDSGSTFNAFALTTTDLVIDITGYYDTSAGGLFLHLLPSPVRLLDTRPGNMACTTPAKPIGAAATLNQVATTACTGIPAGATAVVGNGTVVADVVGSGPGFVTFYPGGGATLPLASNLNYVPTQVVPNAFTVGLGGDGSFNSYALTSIDLVIDLSGYYAAT